MSRINQEISTLVTKGELIRYGSVREHFEQVLRKNGIGYRRTYLGASYSQGHYVTKNKYNKL